MIVDKMYKHIDENIRYKLNRSYDRYYLYGDAYHCFSYKLGTSMSFIRDSVKDTINECNK